MGLRRRHLGFEPKFLRISHTMVYNIIPICHGIAAVMQIGVNCRKLEIQILA